MTNMTNMTPCWFMVIPGGCDFPPMLMELLLLAPVTSSSWMMEVAQVGVDFMFVSFSYPVLLFMVFNSHLVLCTTLQGTTTSCPLWKLVMMLFRNVKKSWRWSTRKSPLQSARRKTGNWELSSKQNRSTCWCARRAAVWWRKHGYLSWCILQKSSESKFPQTKLNLAA